MRKIRRLIRSKSKLNSMTGKSSKRMKLLCELLESRQMMAGDLLSSLPLDSCLAFDSVSESATSLIANQSIKGNATAKAPFSVDATVAESESKEKPTHFYVADGKEMGMVISSSRIAVQFKSSVPDASVLSELGLTYVRPVNKVYAIYESAAGVSGDAMRSSLLNSSTVVDVAPVFVIQSSNSEAVLLDEIIVALKPGVKASDYFDGNANFAAYRALPGTPDQFVATVANGTGEAALAVANQVTSDADVAWVSPNFYQAWKKYFTPNDPRFANQWSFNNSGQGGGLVDADVDLPEAWDINQGGSAAITIGIVDDGVATDHPDIDVWTNPGEIAGDGIDNDANGWIDDVHGWNFVSNNANSQNTAANDKHGTPIAGIAAAKGNNGVGVAGASYNSKVLSAKIFEGTTAAADADIAAALYYAGGRTASGTGTWNAAALVNNSWGGGASTSVINAALTWGTTLGRQGLGATYFFATGNDFNFVVEPALQSLAIPGVVAVGATNNKGELSNYSNFGPAVDIVTPSDDFRSGYLAIDTTDRVGTEGFDPSEYTGTGANGYKGTSAATPLATGIAALMLAQANVLGISLSPVQVRSLLRNNTDLAGNGLSEYSTTTGKNNEFGYGRLNAAAALSGLGKAEISVTGATAEFFDATSSVSLGSEIIGESHDLTLRVRNQGTLPLNLNSLSIASGPFSLVKGFDDSSLALGESTSFTVRFAPTAPGTFTRTVTILSNDLDEAEFTFDLTATAIAPSIGGSVFEDWDGDGVKDPVDVGLAGRTVYLDTVANGVFDTNINTNTFTNSVAVPILDNAVVTSTIAVSGVTNFITDVNVQLNIAHDYDSDIDITLVSPSGKRILLASRTGGGGKNFTNTVLDDEAANSVQTGAAPFTGSFKPFESLSALDSMTGADVNGNWSLEVEDYAEDDQGTILSWSVVIATGEQSAQTKSNGFYSFSGLPNASYTVRTLTPSGWTATGPAGGSNTVTIASASDFFVGRDFGNGQNNKFYGQVFNDFNSDGIVDPSEAGLGGRNLYIDGNTNGVYDTPTQVTLSNTTALSIPDFSSVTSTINSTIDGVIYDVNVRVNFSHTYDADLSVFLIGPDGTQVELFSEVGNTQDDFTNTVLDQEATTGVIGTPGFNTAPFTGSFRPKGDLSVFNGKLASGIWTLSVTDLHVNDVGTLNSWDLIVTASPDKLTTTSANGTASFILSSGTSQIRLAAAAGYSNTIPTDGLRTVTAAGTPLYDQRFGSKALASIANRGLFYNNATGSSAASSLATDKTALLPGQASTFANYTNYTRGLNGLVIDIAGLPITTTDSQMLASLQFANWNGIDTAGFVALPGAAVPTVSILPGNTGTGGSTRVRITFPDNTLQNTWLRVTVLANANTGLSTNDVFYFGNVIADVNVGNLSNAIRVNAADTSAIRNNQSTGADSAGVTNIYDLNRDGRVNAQDTSLVRNNQQTGGLVAPLTAPLARSLFSLRGTNTPTPIVTTKRTPVDLESIDEFFSDLWKSA